jgi:hypothetical protein
MPFIALAFALFAGPAPQAGPPPPAIALIKGHSPSLPDSAWADSERLLNRLQGAHFLLEDSPIDGRAVNGCAQSAEAGRVELSVCMEARMDEDQAPVGTVALAVSADANGAVTWTCVGRPIRPFDGERQRATFPAGALDDPTFETRLKAAACLSYAGHQSGW